MQKWTFRFNFFLKRSNAVSLHSSFEKLTFSRSENDKDVLTVVFKDRIGQTHHHFLPAVETFSIEIGRLPYQSIHLVRGSLGRSEPIKLKIE